MEGSHALQGASDGTSRDGDEPSRVVVMAQRLEAAAGWLREHPEETVYSVETERNVARIRNFAVNTAEDIAEIVKRIGGRWSKDASAEMFYASTTVAPGVVYELVAWRKDVCERVVVAWREVSAVMPDPAMVAALPRVTTTTLEEVVEWHCAPLLGRNAGEPVVTAEVPTEDVPF